MDCAADYTPNTFCVQDGSTHDLLSAISTFPEKLDTTAEVLDVLVQILKPGVVTLYDIKNGNYNENIKKVAQLCLEIGYKRQKQKRKIADVNNADSAGYCIDSLNSTDKKNIKRAKFLKPCYICREQKLTYHSICNKCRIKNTAKRSIKADLTGKVSIVTGARVKIGFETAIRLLECGSTVIATSRFPANTIERYMKHPKYEEFKSRLIVYGLDLRYRADIDKFVQYVYTTFDRLDILINNAAQTIRRPREFYKHLIKNELELEKLITDKIIDDSCLVKSNGDQLLLENFEAPKLVSSTISTISAASVASNIDSQLSPNIMANTVAPPNITEMQEILMYKVLAPLESGQSEFFPENQLDSNFEQIDLRPSNTWVQKLEDVDIMECAELYLINAMAPFYLNQKFKLLMEKVKSDSSGKSKGAYIVNVSSMEGVFEMKNKTPNHPHTNMAKAGLNMMTRTSAKIFAKQNIYMVAVDTGWVTNEFPLATNTLEGNIDVPLDNIDGACRVLDPVFSYYNGNAPLYGVFLKDYEVSSW